MRPRRPRARSNAPAGEAAFATSAQASIALAIRPRLCECGDGTYDLVEGGAMQIMAFVRKDAHFDVRSAAFAHEGEIGGREDRIDAPPRAAAAVRDSRRSRPGRPIRPHRRGCRAPSVSSAPMDIGNIACNLPARSSSCAPAYISRSALSLATASRASGSRKSPTYSLSKVPGSTRNIGSTATTLPAGKRATAENRDGAAPRVGRSEDRSVPAKRARPRVNPRRLARASSALRRARYPRVRVGRRRRRGKRCASRCPRRAHERRELAIPCTHKTIGPSSPHVSSSVRAPSE